MQNKKLLLLVRVKSSLHQNEDEHSPVDAVTSPTAESTSMPVSAVPSAATEPTLPLEALPVEDTCSVCFCDGMLTVLLTIPTNISLLFRGDLRAVHSKSSFRFANPAWQGFGSCEGN